MPQTILPQQQSAHKEFEGLLSDSVIRSKLRKTLKGFGLHYFAHHLYLSPGDFHDEMIGALEDPGIEFLEITASAAVRRPRGVRSSCPSISRSKR